LASITHQAGNEAMSRRLLGLETEYGISIEGVDAGMLVAESRALVCAHRGPYVARWNYGYEDPRCDMRGYRVPELSRDPEDAAFDSAGPGFSSLAEEHAARVLSNGARLYNDHGHPEYSTPECTNLNDLVAHDRAGERIVLECAKQYQQTTGRTVALYKNNTDYHGASYGAHECYLARRDVPIDALIAALIPFLVTRQVFAGAGKVGSDRGSLAASDYQISQRSEFVDVVASVDTQHRRPLFNTRDEPHARPDLYRRLHVICGDANMSEWATALKVGTLALVLDCIESGWRPPITVEDPVRAVRAVALDRDLRVRIRVRNGDGVRSDMTALQIQRLYLDAAAGQQSDLPERDWVLQEWTSVLQDLEEDIWKATDRVDWVAKLWMLEHYTANCATKSPSLDELRSLDLSYHDINPETSLFPAAASELGMRRIVSGEDIAGAVAEPPSDTRAFIRGHFVRHHAEAVSAIGWNGIAFHHDGDEMVFDMNGLVDGQLRELNSVLGSSSTMEDTLAVLRRYRATPPPTAAQATD